MKYTTAIFLLFIPWVSFTQQNDAEMVREIHDFILEKGQCYQWLHQLCTQYPGRLAGSNADHGASRFTMEVMNNFGVDTSYRQETTTLFWERGDIEQVFQIKSDGDLKPLNAISLGRAGATGEGGVTGEVIEVKSLSELDSLPDEDVAGKIVFFNRPMDPTQTNAFRAYGGAVDQRVFGPSRAQKKGALAVLVRSMTFRIDSFPHTGVTVFDSGQAKIPAFGLSTMDAEKLHKELQETPVFIYLNINSKEVEIRSTYNVVGEIKGSEYPDEIILVGGHLDSWDVGQGAHDDGSGCVQAMEVLHTLQKIGYRPKRTIRCVLFANEENGLAGGLEYARISAEKGEFHMASIESDAGGFTPRGFSFDADTAVFAKYYKHVHNWLPTFEGLGLFFEKGGSGADIGPLKNQKGLLVGLRPDSQRYFDYHHTKIDTIENVHERELKLGAAAMASLVYFLDQYGISEKLKTDNGEN